MHTAVRKSIRLREYEKVTVDGVDFSQDLVRLLLDRYSDQIVVTRPVLGPSDSFELTSQGWVGYIPLSDAAALHLDPKIDLKNLFRMLEYAYWLTQFDFQKDLMNCESLEEFYSSLAAILSKHVLARGKKGLFRAYVAQREQLPFLRGRLEIDQVLRRPWDVKPHCCYEEHTPDVEENQILAWTLSRIARNGIELGEARPWVRKAYRSLKGTVTATPFLPADCTGRLYNRLNDDYQPLHALCRFFLEQSGPQHEIGDHTVLPFLIDMAQLFELFVAEWLIEHLPPEYRLRIQEPVPLGREISLKFRIDMVLYDRATDIPLCVIDTKYKAKDGPESGDIQQVISYAEVKRCKDAVLVYPIQFPTPLDIKPGEIRVRSMPFLLDDDLEAAGQQFMNALLSSVATLDRIWMA